MQTSLETLSLEEIEAEICELQKQAELELLVQERTIRSNNLLYFEPNPGGQTTFFEQADCYLRAVFSGNRFGKSTAGTVEDCCWLIGYRPFFPEGHPLRTKGIPSHGVKGLVLAETWEKVRDIFCREGDPAEDDQIGKIFHFLPSHMVVGTKHNAHGVVSQIEVKTELDGKVRKSVLVFDTVRSFLTNQMGKESSDWDFIHVDEPIPQALWDATARGLIDRAGKSWWLMTPITEPWMYHFAKKLALEHPEECWMYQGDTDENLTLGEKEKNRYFGNLSEDAKKARKKGIPLALSRLVLSNFNEERHVLKTCPVGWKNRFTPPDTWMVCAASDTHPQTPHATLKVAISPLGEVIVFSERFKKGSLTGEDSIASYIQKAPEYPQLNYYLLEPAAWNEDQTTKRRFVDDFYEAGLEPLKGSKKRSENNILMNDLLGKTDRYFKVLDHCRVLLREIQMWYFNRDDKPIDANDHLIECLVRLLAHDNFKYRKPYLLSPAPAADPVYSGAGASAYDSFNYSDSVDYTAA